MGTVEALLKARHLTFREDWDQVSARYETWWEGLPLARPLVRITAPRYEFTPEPAPSQPQELYDWFTNPELVLPRLEKQIAATYYCGDAFPMLDPLSQGLAAIQTAYLGAPYRIAADTLTGWTEPLITDWEARLSDMKYAPFSVDPDNPWWLATQALLAEGARRAQGRYVISIPDLQGGGEILALLRGSEQLALDLIDHPDFIPPALDEINTAWLHTYQACYAIIHRYQPGYVDWLGIWSERPAVTVECDFSVMVSPRMFRRFFLPALEQQINSVERSIYHLDGPGQIPHLDAILGIPRLKGVQWIPTPDRPRILDWIPLLQRIQRAGKRVVVACAPDEVLPLLDALQPQTLMLSTSCRSPAEADTLLEAIGDLL